MNVERNPLVEPWLEKKLIEWNVTNLTDIQIKALTAGITTGQSLIVSAPTSSGKTLVAEIAALAALRVGVRVLYLVSHRALADQKYLDFTKRFGQESAEAVASVGLSTGDRSEGEVNADLRVATYEKAIALLLSGQIRPTNTLVIADELQIICDPSRGAEIETLCSVLRQREVKQFVALTATVENPSDLAGWMECKFIQSFERGTPLHQEIWYEGTKFCIDYGQEDGVVEQNSGNTQDVLKVVETLLLKSLGPVLVFTETKKEAAQYAAEFFRDRPRTTVGLAIADQLELFSEPTDASGKLKDYAERAVAFHTADLSAQERQVIEEGFAKSHFEVCFATSTLAAGVNFPFRTIVFSKLTFQYRDAEHSRLGVSDYRNMSGRAGRLGLHPDGYAVILPKNPSELAQAKGLVSPKNEILKSVLSKISLRKTLLSLIASRVVSSRDSIAEFFENTLYWYQTLEKNPKSLEPLILRCHEAIEWLVNHEFLIEYEGELRVTALGKTTAMSGLLPDTADAFAKILRNCSVQLTSSFDEYADGLIYVCCSSNEFRGTNPPRFLPFIPDNAIGAVDFWKRKRVPKTIDTADTQLAGCAQAIAIFINGEQERKIAYATGISASQIQRLAHDVAWTLEGLYRLSSVAEVGCPQSVSNQIALLSRRVRWGVPTEALDLLRVAEKHRVPGVGRQRIMSLLRAGITSIGDVLSGGKKKLMDVLQNSLRVESLIESVSGMVELNENHLHAAHLRVAEALGLLPIVNGCYENLGEAYEAAILQLFRACGFQSAKEVDNRVRQNVPDILLACEGLEALIECKTATKSPALINKEDAWAVLQKSGDFDPSIKRITLGKPAFDETSKRKAAAAQDVTLIENWVLLEALLRLRLGKISSQEFMQWLCVPGLADLDRLPGESSYAN